MFQLRFEHASTLLLLGVLPFIVFLHFYFLRNIQRKGLRFANFRALKRITGKRLITRNYTQLILRLLTVTLLIVATAGPVLWYPGESNESDFVLAVDASASMLAEDVTPTRLEAAKTEAARLVEKLTGETAVGVVSFSAYTLTHTPLTTHHEEVLQALASIAPQETSGTDIPGALITATNLLIPAEHGRTIVLFTDGTNTAELFREQPLREALRYVTAQHTTVHVIGIGTNTGPIGFLPAYYNVSAQYDEETLERIANETGGVYVHITKSDELPDALKEVTQQTTVQQLHTDLSGQTLLVALALLLLEWVLANTRFRALP